MQYQENRSFIGKLLFSATYRVSKLLMKHMWLYYILNYTWGIIMTLIGWISYAFIRLTFRNKIETGKFGPCHYIMIGSNWGGLEMGKCFFVAYDMGDSWTLHTKCHETGHTFQNAILGPFMIFLVSIPSAIRYWYQRIRTKKSKSNKPYDLIWFEGSASETGEYFYKEYIWHQ